MQYEGYNLAIRTKLQIALSECMLFTQSIILVALIASMHYDSAYCISVIILKLQHSYPMFILKEAFKENYMSSSKYLPIFQYLDGDG